MTTFNLIVPGLAMSISLLAGSATGYGASCVNLADSDEAQWRLGTTNAAVDGTIAGTNPKREAKIKDLVKEMEDVILNYQGEYGKGDIPPIEMIPAEGVSFKTEREWKYRPEVSPAYKFSGIGAGGKVRLTILGPVSGHNGNQKAREWSKTDTYFIARALGRDAGRSISRSGVLPAGVEMMVNRARSLDLVTAHEIEVKLDPAQPVFLYYWRAGSDGVAGYPSGRTIELLWDGT